MKITLYSTWLNDDRHATLVKEKSTYYTQESQLDSPEKIVEMMNFVFELNKQTTEYVYMICCNARCNPTGIFRISQGSATETYWPIREIMQQALLVNAVGIILIHNHPSGDNSPSWEDIRAKETILDACKLIGIRLFDNIIVGDGYYSFEQEGIM